MVASNPSTQMQAKRRLRPGTRLTNDQRRRVAKAILAEFDGVEALHLIAELGVGWAEPYDQVDRAAALGIQGLSVEEAIAKVSAGLRQSAGVPQDQSENDG